MPITCKTITEPAEKGRKRKKEVETPNFLKDVIRPILDTLPDLLPEYGFTKTTDDYAMYGEYYRIKAGIVLVGGFSIDEDFTVLHAIVPWQSLR